MSRMFLIEGNPMGTCNCFVGCGFECTYCSARKAALTRFKHLPQFKDGFTPHFIPERLSRRFKPGEFVFIAYNGDISFAALDEIGLILDRIRLFPETDFLFCTKDPACYLLWQEAGLEIPSHVYLGATIETTIDYGLSKAPVPSRRYTAMVQLNHPKKFISVEPIMDMDMGKFFFWMRDIQPSIIEVGADNYHNGLTEPKWDEVQFVLEKVRKFCPNVISKPGLERLK